MQEKTDWELVDEPAAQSGSPGRSQAGAQAEPGIKPLLQAMMGRWWRWKILGAALFAALALALLAMLTGVFALIAATGAILALGVGKVRQWARRQSGALTP